MAPHFSDREVHAMIDIETFATTPDANIVQIGYALFQFNDTGVFQSGYWNVVSPERAAIDSETVRWWMKQSDAARESIGSDIVPLASGLSWLANVLQGSNASYVWAMPPSFDIVILEHWFKYYWPTEALPWKYDRVLDCRTLFFAAGIKKEDRVPTLIKHNAEADAVAQAKTVIKAAQELGLA